jgi:hypothetical protein
MFAGRTQRIAAIVAAAGLAVGAGAAVAATQATSPQQRSEAIVADAAQQLGVSSAKLTAALKQALENQVDAALAAGQITQAQADQMTSAIESGQMPLVGLHGPGGPGGGRHGHVVDLSTAASYLGVTAAELQTSLAGGKSLADVAKAEGKSVDGLVAALVASAKQHLDDEVTAGRLTDAQRTAMLTELEQRIADLVNGVAPAPPALRAGSAAVPTTT